MKRKRLKSILAFTLVMVMVLSAAPLGNLAAAASGTTGAGGSAATVATAALCLKDDWHVYLDEHNLGEEEKWYCGFSGQGTVVSLPHSAGNEGNSPVVWFSNTFTPELDLADGQRLIVSFQGVQYYAKVWLNGYYLGEHEGSFGKFSFDVTDYIRDGEENLLALRLYSTVGTATLRGLGFSNLPIALEPSTYIQMPVYLSVVPEIAIADTYVAAQYDTGDIEVQVIVDNPTEKTADIVIGAQVSPMDKSVALSAVRETFSAQPGLSAHTVTLPLGEFRAWSPADPYLYDVSVNVHADGAAYADATVVTTGFKDLRVDDDGFFALNGERFYVKSIHMTNNVTNSYNSINVGDDLERHFRQLDYLKASGFNMVRFIAGPALPEMMDYCDRIGLLVYEETALSWKKGCEESETLLRREVRQLLERDRSHVSFAILGMLNENTNSDLDGSHLMFSAACNILEVVRAYDENILVLLSSGRWDYDSTIGSASNPGSMVWDGLMGDEGEVEYDGTGDVHYYPHMPYTAQIRAAFAEMGGKRAAFLSEAGTGSQPNIVSSIRIVQQESQGKKGGVAAMVSQISTLYAIYDTYPMSTLFSSPEEFLKETQRLESSQRALFFDYIRSNAMISGYSLTQGGDANHRGEGIFEATLDYKSGMFDSLVDGWSDVRFCVNIDHYNVYNTSTLDTDIYLSNLNVLEDREYTAVIRITGENGTEFKREVKFTPEKMKGGDAVFALSLFKEAIALGEFAEGEYRLSAQLKGTTIAAYKTFWVWDPAGLPVTSGTIYAYGLSEEGIKTLEAQGVTVLEFDYENIVPGSTVVLGGKNVANRILQVLYESVYNDGTRVLGLNGKAFGDWGFVNLPLADNIAYTSCENWLYHFDSVVFDTGATDGLMTGLLDPLYYEDIFPTHYFSGLPTASDMHVLALFVGNPGSRINQPLVSGTQLGTYDYGEGFIILNTLQVTENLGTPLADRIMVNLVDYAISR